ncbi:MAG: VCBS repeat-containing protein, partial [Candidatus Latescibacterota bacterium]
MPEGEAPFALAVRVGPLDLRVAVWVPSDVAAVVYGDAVLVEADLPACLPRAVRVVGFEELGLVAATEGEQHGEERPGEDRSVPGGRRGHLLPLGQIGAAAGAILAQAPRRTPRGSSSKNPEAASPALSVRFPREGAGRLRTKGGSSMIGHLIQLQSGLHFSWLYRRFAGAGLRAGPAALALLLAAGPLGGAAIAGFTEIPEFGDGHTLSVAWGDCDNDGDLDLAVGNNGSANELFVNDGTGSFTRQTPFGTWLTFAVAWGDYDNDGDLDLAVGNGGGQQNKLYVNQGDGTFLAEDQFGTGSTVALAWADFDVDGDIDLAAGNGILGSPERNFLYINNGDGTFTERFEFGRKQTDSVVWGDYDADGDPDLAIGNGGFGAEDQNALSINNGDGTFTRIDLFGMGDTACLAWADSDNDGDLDLAVGNWETGANLLDVNNGDGTFTELPRFGDRDTNTLSCADFDNDGDLDAAVGNGDFVSADSNFLYVSNGDGTFLEVPEFGLGSTDAIAWGDCDGDGDLDAAVGNE